MTGPPPEYSFRRYLAAKKRLDDRSLNRRVWGALAQAVKARPDSPPLEVLEAGCGIGTMLERLIDWDLLGNAIYTGIDSLADNISEARQRVRYLGWVPSPPESKKLILAGCSWKVAADFQVADVFEFIRRRSGRSSWDLIIAHAFLDLVDLGTTLPGLLSLLAPGGLFYFTLNFDGVTALEPTIDPELDRLIETLYHRSMDQRLVKGRPAGSSHTGRRLFEQLRAAGATVRAAGSSDWVVFPGPEGYPGDEAYFLHFIIHTVHQALEGHPELPEADFRAWVTERHAQIQRQELIYLARQLDFFGQV